MNLCPCGSEKNFDECCGPYLNGSADVPTAEALMRSRYTAFAVNDMDYLVTSLSEELRREFDVEETREMNGQVTWCGLHIFNTTAGQESDEEGIVEFQAEFDDGKDHRVLHERSRFTRENGKWVYAEGLNPMPETVRREGKKVGRNDPCPCGSGKKFKKCCGKN